MPVTCPLCSAALPGASLEGHLRLELDLPLAQCRLCRQAFCDDQDAEEHFRGPAARHPGQLPALIQPPADPGLKARLRLLLRWAREGAEALESRLYHCGSCRLKCGESASKYAERETQCEGDNENEARRDDPIGARHQCSSASNEADVAMLLDDVSSASVTRGEEGGLDRYVPEVARFPRQWVYEPWLAPPAAQKAARCVIGTDYPKPIVDHAKVSKANIQRMKEAFAVNKAAASSSSDAPPSPPKKKAHKAM